MKLRILVSCDSDRTEFIDCIKGICDENVDEFEYHFIPNEIAPLNEPDRLHRMMLLVDESHIVFMDVTPKKYSLNRKEDWLANQGVLIEYGVLVSSKYRYKKLCLFCEDTVSRSLLHPYFIKTVHQYSIAKLNDGKASKSLRRQVKKFISDYKGQLLENVIELQKQNEIYENYTNILKRR